MKRLGKYTGKIYDNNEEAKYAGECCTIITDVQANDDKFIENHHRKDLMNCFFNCGGGCPAYLKDTSNRRKYQMMIYDKRIKPCPICGGECYYDDYILDDLITCVCIKCRKCGLRGQKDFINPAPDAVERTIEYWNNRV